MQDTTKAHTTTLLFDTPSSDATLTVPAGTTGTLLTHASGTVAQALTLTAALTVQDAVDLTAAKLSGTSPLVLYGANTGNSNKCTVEGHSTSRWRQSRRLLQR